MAELGVAAAVARDILGSRPGMSLPLTALEGEPLGPYTLRLTGVVSHGYVEQINFNLNLCDVKGRQAAPPVFSGIYSSGRPAEGIIGWIDGAYCSPVGLADGGQIDLAQAGLDRRLFARLGDLIPPGGRLMVAYEAFHLNGPVLRQTSEALRRGVPPLVTPIGELLFYGDCWLGMRDWYIPEGGREGPRKLQGNKALNARHRQQRAEEALQQLLAFLGRTGSVDDPLIQAARRRSARVVEALQDYVAVPTATVETSPSAVLAGICSAWD